MNKEPNTGDKKPTRQEKLAEALRANLKRRKAAKRATQNTEKESGNG
tara:strand:+ start:414 stop:554 length:141 start_codon:yes stop_codon:yes gene_type:complete